MTSFIVMPKPASRSFEIFWIPAHPVLYRFAENDADYIVTIPLNRSYPRLPVELWKVAVLI
jgi:hypothetical protein